MRINSIASNLVDSHMLLSVEAGLAVRSLVGVEPEANASYVIISNQRLLTLKWRGRERDGKA